MKARPIAPCHSALQNPVAKYLSKLLKPLIAKSKYIINGTKQFTDALRTVRLEPGRPFTIISGDIVAFYPNVPTDEMTKVMGLVWREYWREEVIANPEMAMELPDGDTFDDILHTALSNLLVEGQDGTVYRQIRGLAMGVACSPDIANLYGDWFEKQWIHQARCVAYYCRYIDDIFAVVYLDKWDEAYTGPRNARDYMDATIAFEGCTIDWGAPARGLAFLDLWVYIDSDNTIQWKPYRKPGNHLERIPWDSAHPIDVKRGTFIGELSRLATLSSKLEHYLEASRFLAELYVARGYPLAVI